MISDTSLRALMPKNVRKITERYKHMRGCKICVIICYTQASLNSHCLQHLNLLREKSRAKYGWMTRSGVDSNNDVYLL